MAVRTHDQGLPLNTFEHMLFIISDVPCLSNLKETHRLSNICLNRLFDRQRIGDFLINTIGLMPSMNCTQSIM